MGRSVRDIGPSLTWLMHRFDVRDQLAGDRAVEVTARDSPHLLMALEHIAELVATWQPFGGAPRFT
jgi:hypothetical protein